MNLSDGSLSSDIATEMDEGLDRTRDRECGCESDWNPLITDDVAVVVVIAFAEGPDDMGMT